MLSLLITFADDEVLDTQKYQSDAMFPSTSHILPTLGPGLPSAVSLTPCAGWGYKTDTYECVQVTIALDID